MTSLARALSHNKLDQVDFSGACPSRNAPLYPCRRRKLSFKSSDSTEAAGTPVTVEARVLVLNTGGTIGMAVHDDGNYDLMLLIVLVCLLRGGS